MIDTKFVSVVIDEIYILITKKLSFRLNPNIKIQRQQLRTRKFKYELLLKIFGKECKLCEDVLLIIKSYLY